MTDPDQIVFIAVLPPEASRRSVWWLRMFGERRVPVKSDTPEMTALPDGTNALCYFVDFNVTGDEFLQHLKDVAGQKPYPVLLAMLEERIYPVHAEGVTVVRGPLSLWRRE